MLKKEGNGWARGAEGVSKGGKKYVVLVGVLQSVVKIRQHFRRATVCVEVVGQMVQKRHLNLRCSIAQATG